MTDPLPVVILLLVCLLFAALCKGAKVAIEGVNDYKMKEIAKEGSRKAKRVIKLTEKESRVLASLRTAVTTFNVAGILVSYVWVMSLLSAITENLYVILVLTAVVYVTAIAVFSDMVPRKICASKPDECAMSLSGFVSVVWNVFRPLSFIYNFIAEIFVLITGNDPDGDREQVTEDDVKMMVDLGSETGTIAPEEKELITNIFEFGDMCADDVMTHRKDVTVLMLDESAEEWEETIRESGFSRFPVCGEDIDDIVGVVYARELYEFFYDKGEDVKEIIHQAYIVPEKIGADLLFENMQKEKTHFAIVADEYGGFAGIVTMDDLLGCIVGEIEDEEYDEEAEEEREDVVLMEENLWDVDGLIPLEELSALTGRELPVDQFDTLSGLVLDAIEAIPDDGTTVNVTSCGLEINATEIKDRRIVRATVRKTKEDN